MFDSAAKYLCLGKPLDVDSCTDRKHRPTQSTTVSHTGSQILAGRQ